MTILNIHCTVHRSCKRVPTGPGRQVQMEIRQLTQADIKQVRSVWKECFNDSDAFLDTYFESVVDMTSGIGFFDDGTLVSDLFETPLNAQIGGMVYESLFLSGCATMPEARNQHLMQKLIRAALADMRARNICVSYLHPFLHSFYRKFGYETVNFVHNAVALPQSSARSKVVSASSFEDLPSASMYASYEAYVTQYGNYFMRSESRMTGWLKLLFSDGGRAVFIDGEENTPYALFYPETDPQGQLQNNIFELVYFSDAQLQLLTQGTGAQAQYFLPCSPRERDAAEFTMMRVVCPEIMLANYAYQPGTRPFVINIHDPFLGHDYNLHVSPKQGGGADVAEVESASDIVVGVADLAWILTGMYDPLKYPDATQIFPQGSSCYFDTY